LGESIKASKGGDFILLFFVKETGKLVLEILSTCSHKSLCPPHDITLHTKLQTPKYPFFLIVRTKLSESFEALISPLALLAVDLWLKPLSPSLKPFYNLVPLGHPVLSTCTTFSRTTNLIESKFILKNEIH